MSYNSLIAGLILLCSFNALASPSLWQVSNGSQQWWLFGAIHLGKADYYPLPASYYDRLQQADQLVVELDLSQVSISQQQLMWQQGSLNSEQNLQQQLPAKQWQQLQPILSKLAFPESQAKQLKPWYLNLIMVQLRLQQLGYNSELGLDLHFTEHAKQQGINIHPLESFEQQLLALSSLEAIQWELLAQSINEFSELPQLIQQMENHWLAGENQALYALLMDDPMFQQQSAAVMDSLLFKRNRLWMQQLLGLKGNSFVVVGALHLYGEQGLIAEFKKLGYQVSLVTAVQ